MVSAAGGLPVLLPPLPEHADRFALLCDGVVFSGGGDPIMERFGEPTHPGARTVDPRRQEFELALLRALEGRPQTPVLGVCLGMQLMGLHHGGALDQQLSETLPTAGCHWPEADHRVEGALGSATVRSNHRQALVASGALSVVAASDDGVIEAVRHDGRPFYVGVQWHPERTADERLGIGLFRQLVRFALRPA